ncbi:MAG TPA: DUF6798 domain-containing protein [Bryobacteraceae bacterium]|nr:DUF6798 domain-containing protein [Bryobacteraceae bacterium]
MNRRIAFCIGVLLLTFAGYFFFPGHTYLLSDTQIYIPMFDHLRDASLFTRDIMALRPHLSYTIYDETALLLVRITRLSFETVLQTEQILFRALGIAGLVLLARRLLGDPMRAAIGPNAWEFGLEWCAAAIVSLGATLVAPAVLIFEYEPVPRGFAVCLLMFAMGLLAQGRDRAAGIAAGFALLYHPPTAAPFWIVAALLIRRRALLFPFLPAAAILLVLAKMQAGVTESPAMFRKLDWFQESLQQMRASYSFVSMWATRNLNDYAAECLVAAVAIWRLHGSLTRDLRALLIGLPVVGLLCVPLSWVLLEKMHWALIPQWQPARAVLFITLIAMLAAAVCGLRAATERRWIEAVMWLAAAYFGPIKHAVIGRPWNWQMLELFAGFAIVTTLAVWLSSRTRGITLIAAALLPFAAIPASGLVRNYRQIETPELDQVVAWARANTPVPALFLFPDAGTGLEPGIFRVRAQRALYTDWKSGGQVNYFPMFTSDWWKRWIETNAGRWKLKASDFSALADRSIDYVVLQTEQAVPGVPEAFRNSKYVVYQPQMDADRHR